MWDDLRPPTRNQGFSGQIRNGYRAFAISVDATSSVSNLVRPGDNVDVIGTFTMPDLRGDSSLDTVTLTLLQNVKVLATGNRWGRQGMGGETGGQSNYMTVTLQLFPHEVELMAFATLKGRLMLSLRNFEETKIDKNSQSVNFRYLQEQLPKYNEIRERFQSSGR